MSDATTVLIVEDEADLADLFAAWLEDDYEVRVAYDGESALEQFDAAVDIALLDRRMPGMAGDEVLDAIRERELDCRVAMVTAVEPSFDIIEMGFDDYVVKPVERDELRELVEQLTDLRSYDDVIERYYQLAAKKAALEESKSREELAESAEYAALLEEFERVQERSDALVRDESTERLF